MRVVGDADSLRCVEAEDAVGRAVDTVSIDTVVQAVKGVVKADMRAAAHP